MVQCGLATLEEVFSEELACPHSETSSVDFGVLATTINIEVTRAWVCVQEQRKAEEPGPPKDPVRGGHLSQVSADGV